MTQEELAQVRKTLEIARNTLGFASTGIIDVARLNVDTCEAVLSWLAYVVTQEEERVQAEATKGQMTHQEFVDEILRQAEKTKAAGGHE